jgi:hypothetical protein
MSRNRRRRIQAHVHAVKNENCNCFICANHIQSRKVKRNLVQIDTKRKEPVCPVCREKNGLEVITND